MGKKLVAFVFIFSSIFDMKSAAELTYNFSIKNGKSELQAKKKNLLAKVSKIDRELSGPDPSPKNSSKSTAPSPDTYKPLEDFGNIMKHFIKVLESKKRSKRNKQKRKRSRELTKLGKAKQKTGDRNAFLGKVGGLAAGLGGAALGVGAIGMVMGAMGNKKIKNQIDKQKTAYATVFIKSKLSGDINIALYNAVRRIKCLRSRAKTMLTNTDNKIDRVAGRLENVLGNISAMDKGLWTIK